MAQRVQEKGSILQGTSSRKTSGCNVFDTEAVTAMDISTKEQPFIAVAGRKMLKILTVQRNVFREVANLCSTKKGKMSLDYSITDVRWEPAGDERLATAAGNGTILVWNVNLLRNSRQVNNGKRDITVHKRTVNRISFHPTDRDCLISCSQDGTMRCFDLRKPDVVSVVTFQSKSRNASIRDVKFKPFDGKYFAAATEFGEIQLWDTRKLDGCVDDFVAHIGPVFSIDWHPEEPYWLGTAGRDKFIKVWNTQHKPVEETYQIRGIAEVARVKWRPARKYHIASCALLVDNCVSVWDIRRPYIPHAQFTQHQDSVTGIAWHKDTNILFSCGKDSMIYQNCFADAYRPAEHVPPVALGISSTGSIAFARSDQFNVPEPKPKQKFNAHLTASLGAVRTQHASKVDEVHAVTSTLYTFTADCLNDLDRFKVLAKSYRLSGLPFSELCDHNSKQCSKLGLNHHAQTWNIIKVMYSCSFTEIAPASPTSLGKTGQTNCLPGNVATAATENVNQNSQPAESFSADDKEVQSILSKNDTASDQQSDDSSASDGDGITESEMSQPDFVFSEEQDFQFDSQDINAEMQLEDYTLSNEAFEPRQDIEDRPPSLEADEDRPETPISAIDSDITSAYNQQTSFVESSLTNNEQMNAVLFPKWDCSGVVKDCLKYYANKGDIQMCVSVLLVLGDKIRAEIDEKIQEHWLLSYMDLLNRLQMWTISTEIMNISNLPALTELSQTSTTVHTICSNEKCRKLLPLDKCGWSCDQCKSLTPACSICNTTVRGLLAWCQGCGHGGHLRHIKDWFKKYRSCPTGCGHSCEYR